MSKRVQLELFLKEFSELPKVCEDLEEFYTKYFLLNRKAADTLSAEDFKTYSQMTSMLMTFAEKKLAKKYADIDIQGVKHKVYTLLIEKGEI